jgi:uncharacterized membrane protein YbhN (UPF0104 family)
VRKVFGILDSYRARPWSLLWNALVAVGFHLLRCAAVAIGAAARLGVQEAGFVYLYGVFGMPAAVALVLSLVMRACTIVLSAPGAWFYIVRGVRA